MCNCPDDIPEIFFSVKPVGKGKYVFRLDKPYRILIRHTPHPAGDAVKNTLDWHGAWWYLEIPEGFESDLASLPNWSRVILDSKQNVVAAVCHDYLWWKNKQLSNQVFSEILKREGTPTHKHWLMVKAVNLKLKKETLQCKLLNWWRNSRMRRWWGRI